MTPNKLQVNCPTCQKRVLWNETSPYRPFCSDRCKLIDLGAWADESHRIPGNTGEEDSGFEWPDTKTES